MEKPQSDESIHSGAPRFDGHKLAQRIAAIHGTVPITITGRKFDPAVAVLLWKIQQAHSVPPSDTFRCK